MWLHLSKSVALSMMVACLLTFAKLGALILISITLYYIFVDSCTYANGCTFTLNTSSSSTSFCVTCSSIDCYSTPLSSFDFSMFTGSTKVVLGPTYTFELQPFLYLRKNSTTNVPVLNISWIIMCINYIFSLYVLPSSHYEYDGECCGDLTTNGWMFNTLELFVLLNFSFASFFLNSFVSSSYLCLCSFFYGSFSLITLCNFSIALKHSSLYAF